MCFVMKYIPLFFVRTAAQTDSDRSEHASGRKSRRTRIEVKTDSNGIFTLCSD